MTAQVSQNVVVAGTTPAALTPAATDTISEGQFGNNGLYARVITTGTATTVTTLDPNRTSIGNAGVGAAVTCPATGIRMIFIPRGAIDPATGSASLTFSGALTGVTYELYRA
ncbi:MAG: hypothetical protein ABW022_10205 [Actinoplanes sp.]